MVCGTMQSGCVLFSEKVYANRSFLSKDPEKLCKRINPDPEKHHSAAAGTLEDGASIRSEIRASSDGPSAHPPVSVSGIPPRG